MCGICGFNWPDKALAKSMVASIRHRGPDQEGVFVDGNVSLGHARLSIIDLSEKGRQPMSNGEGDVIVVFNGEIYNYLGLRKRLEKRHRFISDADTEVLVHGYREWGAAGLLERLDGMFAFAVYDSGQKKLVLARDRLGKKPLYYYHEGGRFLFASEIKAIIEDRSIERKVDIEVLNQFFARRFSPEDRTMFSGIRKLMPGKFMVYDLARKTVSISRYWDIDIGKAKLRDRAYLKKELRRLFVGAVEKRLMSDVPLGIYLSGGIDSSTVVGAMSSLVDEQVKTFSVGFSGDDISNELPYARKTSEYFSTDHQEIEIGQEIIRELPKIAWHLDEPLADPAVIPNYVLSREAKKKVTVVLTGDGGDELFLGYDQYRFMKWGDRLRLVPGVLRKKAMPAAVGVVPKSVLDRFYKYSSSTGEEMLTRLQRFSEDPANKAKQYLELMSIFDAEERERLFNKNTASKISDFDMYGPLNRRYFQGRNDLLTRASYFDLKSYLPEDLLMKPDKMCMAFGVEARVPLLDQRLVELAFRIPDSYKLGMPGSKLIMKQALREFIAPHILKRKKQTFNVPIDQWFGGGLMEYCTSVFEHGRELNMRYFKKKEIGRILSRLPGSRLFYARQLWSIMNFDLWHNIFIDGEKPERLRF